jgi:sugar/nucleoside kinase (ribokinase family)
MKEALGALGIECKLVKSVKGMQTPVSFSWADQQGGKHFDFYRFPGFSDPMQSLQRKDFPQSLFEEYDFFDFSENMIRRAKLRAAALAAAARAQKAGCRVIYAVNLRLQAWQEPQASIRTIQRRALAASNVAVMNADELAFITQARSVEAGLKKIHSLGPEIVAVTAGEGVSLVSTPEGVTELPAFPVDVVYDVGAGDCFHGGFVAGLARGLAPASAGVLANAVAAWRVSKAARLEQLPTLEQIEEFIAHRY